MRLSTLLVAGTILLGAGCAPYAEPVSFYVVVAPDETERFYAEMIVAVARHRMDPNPGTADDGRGSTLYVVEGKGRGVRVWSVNLPISERESVACGGPKRSGIDPSQFVVRVSDRTPFSGEQTALVAQELIGELRANGFDVRTEPRRCRPEPAH